MILSEQEKSWLDAFFNIIKLVQECQHKADQEDFQKQKQEMWRDMLQLDSDLNITDAEKAMERLCDFKHKWGIE